jgi:hypothetical protein
MKGGIAMTTGPYRTVLLGVVFSFVLASCNKGSSSGSDLPDASDTDSSTADCGSCQAATVDFAGHFIDSEQPTSEAHICYDTWHADDEPECVVQVELNDVDECPFDTEPGVETVVESWVDQDDVEHTKLYCALARLPAPIDCAEAEELYPPETIEVGWYYCQVEAETCEYTIRFTDPTVTLISEKGMALVCSDCKVESPSEVVCTVDSQVVGKICEPTSFDEPLDEAMIGRYNGIEIHEQCGGGQCLSTKSRLSSDPDVFGVYHHCTCRCGDLEGNDHTTSSELCQCPGGSVCEPICEFGTICPELLQGAFCLPGCVANPCMSTQTCTPPDPGSDTPWEWTCE